MWRSARLTRSCVVIFRVEKTLSRVHGHRMMAKKEYHTGKAAKRQKNAANPGKDGSNEEVLLADVNSLLSRQRLETPELKEGSHNQPLTLLQRFSEIEVKILELSSTGDGLGIAPTLDHVYVVPFTVPGDVVQAKTVNTFATARYTSTDFVKVITPGSQRNDSLPKCPYFAKCAGCQLQMLSYDDQLQHKKSTVEKAFRNFSALAREVIPPVGDTIGSPIQYGYRTKLTPHFDGPPGSMSRRVRRDPSQRKGFEEVPPIGFLLKGTRKTIDIEDCPIGTSAVREGLKIERKSVTKEIATYTKGATILLRENTTRKPTPNAESEAPATINGATKGEACQKEPEENIANGISTGTLQKQNYGDSNGPAPYIEEKTYISDQKAIATEYVDEFVFKNTAGAFFQNNSSILPKFTAYIRDHIMPVGQKEGEKPIKYLIDAYCGSGLFTVTLSSLFSSSLGIDIAGASIVSARENATANNVSNATFMTADASKLFEEVTYPAEKTVVVIDPPRKGCDGPFLQQLMRFGPQRVIYVSCNVHTQARDIGVLVEGKEDCRYEIESLQGFDFFPQTGHVEGVAVLARCMPSSQRKPDIEGT